MVDPFGIIGVIGVACQIVQMGIRFELDWKDAPADVKSFMAELQLTDVTPATDTSVMVSACRTELEHLLTELKKRAHGHRVGWERMKGAFLAKKTREAVKNLQRQCQFLNSLVVIDSAALQATILKEVREGTMKQQAREAADEQNAILNWLTPADYALQQSDFINRRQAGTGQWLLGSPEFQVWLQSNEQTLFCHSMPGAGKTILTSIVVDELMARFENDKNTGIAYIYCNFRRQDEQKAEDLFASLLKQLAQGKSSLPDSVKSLHNKFLLAQLYVDSLKGKKSPKAIRAALKNLATGSDAYDRAYNDAMERIEGQLKDEKELAKEALYWLACAKRPLTTIELQHALAVEVGETELDQENVTCIQDIISEYFERTQDKWFPNAAAEAAIACVTYLSFSAFESGFCLTDEEFKARLQSNPFYDYAATNWGHHAREASTFMQEVIDFLERDTKVEASSQPLMFKDEYFFRGVPGHMTGLHLAAYFGVYEAAKVLPCGEDVDPKDSSLRTPLSAAAEYGREAVVQLLLEKGADIESKSSTGWTPLWAAAQHGHEAVVKLLLEKGADIESKDKSGATPLLAAAVYGHEAVVKMLLEKGADMESKCDWGRTPLWAAAKNGHEAAIKLLLEKGADIESKDNKSGQTPLFQAAAGGHAAVVQLLLDRGADVSSKNKDGQTSLSWPPQSGYEAIVKRLQSKA
ncbi:hypothetical protein DL765_006228 [Monosporascus sp. GIB2]|nr:hypothetical protein DL765_006228 [Monosporascus sp. GIB2]